MKTFFKALFCLCFGAEQRCPPVGEMELGISACCSEETKPHGNHICPEMLFSTFVSLALSCSA